MKIKDVFSPLFFFVLGTAFLAISLWVWFSNGKNAKAIKAKYKLGGMILSLSFFATTGCEPVITCYDPVPEEYVIIQKNIEDSIFLGDTISVIVMSFGYPNFSYSLSDSTVTKVIQEGMLTTKNNNAHEFSFVIDKDLKYTGKVKFEVFGELTTEIKKTKLIHYGIFMLYAPKN
ncbi:MAG TPA: hypothetical protein P5084_08865 [Paludibacter sp.]|nr:hypothetical protein [Paludibacter sp.]